MRFKKVIYNKIILFFNFMLMKKIRWLYSIFLFFGLFFCVLFTNFTANAESIRTIKNGNWSDPSVWDLGRIPTENDSVEINNELKLTNGNQIVDELKVNQNAVLKDYSLKVNTKLINNGQIKTSIYLKGNAEINGNIDGYLNLLNGSNSIFSGNGTIGNLSISQNATIGGNIKVKNFYSSSSSNTTFLGNTNIEVNGNLNLYGNFSNGNFATFTVNYGSLSGTFSGNIKELIINGSEQNPILHFSSKFNFNKITINGYLKHYSGSVRNNGGLVNNGNTNSNLYISGNIEINGDMNGTIYLLDGANSIFSGEGTIGSLTIYENVSIGGNIKTKSFYSNSNSNINFLGSTNIEVNGSLDLNGNFSNGNFANFTVNSGSIGGDFSGSMKELIINGSQQNPIGHYGSKFNFKKITINGYLKRYSGSIKNNGDLVINQNGISNVNITTNNLVNYGKVNSSIYLKGNAEINSDIDGTIYLLDGANSIFSGEGTIGSLTIYENVSIGGNIKTKSFYSNSNSNINFLGSTNIEFNGSLDLNGNFSNGNFANFTVNSGSIGGDFSGSIKELIINGSKESPVSHYSSKFNFNKITINGYLKHYSGSVRNNGGLVNNGNTNSNLYISGNIEINSDMDGIIYLLNGANSIFSGEGTIGNLTIYENVSIGGNIKTRSFYSDSNSNINFLNSTSIGINGNIDLYGSFSNGDYTTFIINSGGIGGNFSGNIKELIINGTQQNPIGHYGSNFNFKKITINGYLKYYSGSIKNNGDLVINQNGVSDANITVNNLINYGEVRKTITIKQNIENTSNKINYITFSWEEEKNENKYSSYVIKVPGEDEKTTSWYTYYFSRRNLKGGGTTFPLDYQNEYWEVYGIRKSDGARELLKRKCINVVGCIQENDENNSNFDYSNPITSNNSNITQKNIPSIAKTAIEYAKITNNSIIKGVNTSLWKQKENNITQNLNEKNAGDPVELSSGEFIYENTLINRKGIGLDFKFDVYYKNQSYYNGPIGYKFDFNYNKFLLENEDGSVNYHDGKLGMISFTKNADGSYNYNKNLKAKLIKQDPIYKLVFDDGKKFSFSENLKISKIEDSFGNNITINYSGDKISQITDTIGNNYLFAYYDDSRIKEIISSPTEKVRFVYYAENEEEGNKYDLKNIQLFSGDDIKEIKFTYTKNPDEKLAHNIVKLYDLNGNVYVENSYEENRVISQKYGDGTINYLYTLDSGGEYVNQNKVTNKSGNVTIYNYDKNGNTLSMLVKGKTESEDVLYSHQYNENGKLSKDINPNQSGTKYIYDNKGNLIEKRQKADINAEDSDNDLVFKYEYNDKNILTKTINPYGIIVENVYGDKQELVKTITKASSFDDIVTTYTYDDRGNVIKKIDSIGQTHYEYDEKGNLTKTIKVGETEEQNITVSFEYDEKGNLSRKTDELGNQTNYEYDNFNNLIKTIEANGLVSEFEYDNQNNKTKTKILLPNDEIINSIFEYDVLDNPTKTIVDINQNTTKGTITKYNPDGKIVSIKKESEAEITYKYNIFEKVIQKDILVNPDDPSQNITEKYEYDSVGNLVKTINPRNHITNYEYDKFNRLTKIIDASGNYKTNIYDKAGNIIEEKSYDSSGNVLAKNVYIYDALGRLKKSSKILLEESREISTENIYNQKGQVVETKDANQNSTYFSYDHFGRIYETTDSLGNKTRNIYDKKSQIIEKILISNSKNISTKYEFDSNGKIIKQTDSLGNNTLLSYDKLGRLISKADKKGNVYNYTYDYRGLVLSEKIGENSLKTFSYDLMGNMISSTDSNGNTTSYTYDNLARLTKILYPDGNYTSYTYDQNNNLKTITLANGTIIEHHYDSLDRLISKNISKGANVLGVESETYAYDDLGRLISANDSAGNQIQYEYDSLGRIKTESNNEKTIAYTYDDNGKLLSKLTPLGRYQYYSYDALGRLTKIKSNQKDISTYNYSGIELFSENLGNGISTNYTYDSILRLSSIDYKNTDNSSKKVFNYSYDSNDNIVGDGFKNYTYDDLDRILTADSQVFSYDLVGNRTSDTVNNLNQIVSKQDQNFSYDLEGNLQQDPNKKYFYDYKNRLIQVTDLQDNIIVTYSYDVLGRRLSKTLADATIIKYTYSGKNIILEENIKTKADGEQEILKKEYIYSNKIDDVVAVYIDERLSEDNEGVSEDEGQKISEDTSPPAPLLGEERGAGISTLNNENSSSGTINEENIENSQSGSTEQDTNTGTVDEGENESSTGTTNDGNSSTGTTNDPENSSGTGTTENETGTGSMDENGESESNTGSTETPADPTPPTIEIQTNLYFYQKNHLGTPLFLSNENGEIVESYETDVFGNIISGSDSSRNSLFFTGKNYDKETGFYFFNARYYSPELARFISRDPIGIADDIHLYAYVKNNPLKFTDPTGLAAKEFVKKYDEYNEIKGKIYYSYEGFNFGKFKLSFLNLDNNSQKKLLKEFFEKEKIAKELHYDRNRYNVDLPKNKDEAEKFGWIKMSNEKSIYHQIGVPEGKWNEKWVSEDGKKEVIYSYKDGSIITDPTNYGTYNFYGPGSIKDDYYHALYDVAPYIEWGNHHNDKSNIEQRKSITREGIIKATK
ncbi:hypothetical protein DLH72_01870 [Candidatus Gracilibacteria bacterium]|nr:MAG: hypothetical protein DLH72_01870 [Candidatus Gracilibacteria bacterium]